MSVPRLGRDAKVKRALPHSDNDDVLREVAAPGPRNAREEGLKEDLEASYESSIAVGIEEGILTGMMLRKGSPSSMQVYDVHLALRDSQGSLRCWLAPEVTHGHDHGSGFVPARLPCHGHSVRIRGLSQGAVESI